MYQLLASHYCDTDKAGDKLIIINKLRYTVMLLGRGRGADSEGARIPVSARPVSETVSQNEHDTSVFMVCIFHRIDAMMIKCQF